MDLKTASKSKEEIALALAVNNSSSNPRPERTKLSNSQFGLIVDFVTLHPELVRKFSGPSVEEKWEELASLLNSDSTGARKSVRQWKKSWNDLKFYIKHKIRKNNASKLSRCQNAVELTELEKKVLNLIKQSSSHINIKYPSLNEKRKVESSVSSHPSQIEETRCILVNINGSPLSNEQIDSTRNMFFKIEPLDNDAEHFETIEDDTDEPQIINGTGCDHNGFKTTAYSSSPTEIHTDPEVIIAHSIPDESNHACGRHSETVNNSNNNEKSIIQLLQRQNVLLECLASSMTRIEKSLKKDSTQEIEKKHAIQNIVENVDKIADCLKCVSNSLKKISE